MEVNFNRKNENFELIMLPLKHSTRSTKAPKAKNIEVTIGPEKRRQQKMKNLIRYGRQDI